MTPGQSIALELFVWDFFFTLKKKKKPEQVDKHSAKSHDFSICNDTRARQGGGRKTCIFSPVLLSAGGDKLFSDGGHLFGLIRVVKLELSRKIA